MILNSRQIAKLAANYGMIFPFSQGVREEGKISHGLGYFGYDIRLGRSFCIYDYSSSLVIDPKKRLVTPRHYDSDYEGKFLIPPHSYALGVSLEKFIMPDDVIGICLGKSTYARCGVIVNMTPLEPGWIGHLTIEISNANSIPVYIYEGEGVAQVLFFRGEKPGNVYGGKYQNQGEVVTMPKV